MEGKVKKQKSRGDFLCDAPTRSANGRFLRGNTQCFLGWEGLRRLFECLGGTEADRDEWWRRKALYHSDKPYWGTRVQKFFDPGTPREFMERKLGAMIIPDPTLPHVELRQLDTAKPMAF